MTPEPDTRHPSVDGVPPGPTSTERFVILTAALGTMLAPLNSTMIAVALPGIMEEFDVGVGQASWLVTAYLVAMASLQPPGGKIGDRLGRRPLVIYGLALFGLVSLGASAAPNLWVTLVFRVLQAVLCGPNTTQRCRFGPQSCARIAQGDWFRSDRGRGGDCSRVGPSTRRRARRDGGLEGDILR